MIGVPSGYAMSKEIYVYQGVCISKLMEVKDSPHRNRVAAEIVGKQITDHKVVIFEYRHELLTKLFLPC